ncbi:MAG TPA: hypothetical protein PLM33_10890 [Acidobacteriota bacterium]|jgi:hypothetical protein|nr:hypothetical protein [Acidobacteriota bacterium]
MKKAILILVGVLVVILIIGGVAFYWLYSNLDRLVQQAIEEQGTRLTGTQVTLESVTLELREGRGTLTGLRIANPKGFTPGDAIKAGRIVLALDLASLQSDPLVLREIELQDVGVLYERNRAGSGNLETIRDNLTAATGQAEPKAPESTEERRLRIMRLAWNEGLLTARLPGREDPLQLELPALEMSDVGGPQGAPPEEIGRQVLDRFLQNVIDTAVQRGLQRFIEEKVPEGTQERIRQLEEKVPEGTRDRARKLLESVPRR